jgi:O-antigen/teichoic acid export membrane protein
MSLLKNGIYNAITGLVRAGLVLVTIPILTRLLGIQDYGLWSLVSAVLEVVVLSGNGISVSTTLFTAKDLAQKDVDKSLSKTLTVIGGAIILLATIGALGIFFGARSITNFFPNLDLNQVNTFTYALQISALVVWSRLLQQVFIGIEQGYQQYGYLNLLNTIQAVTLNIGMLVIAANGGKIIELIEWQAAMYLSILIGHVMLVKKLLKPSCLKFSWNSQYALEIAHHSLTNLFLCIGSVIFGRGDRIVVAYFLTPSILGIYAAVTDIAAGMNTLSNLPVQPLISLLGNYLGNAEFSKNKLKVQIAQSLELNAAIALGLGAWLFALAPVLVRWLFSNVADEASVIIAFRVAIIIYALISINSVGFYTLLTLDVNLCMILYVVNAFISLTLIVFGASKFGLVGALLGNIGFLLSWSMLFFGMIKLNLSKWFWMKHLKFPLTWFIFFISIATATRDNFLLSIGISILETLAFTYWFFTAYQNNKQSLAKLTT